MKLNVKDLLRDLPDSKCARQIESGYRALRFSKGLEKDYRAHMDKTQGSQHKIAILLAIAVWLLFTIMDFQRFSVLEMFPELPDNILFALLIRWVFLVIFVVSALLIFLGALGKYGQKAALTLLFLIGVGTALINVLYISEHVPHERSVLILVIVAVFFPIGLSFYASFFTALAICIFSSLVSRVLLSGTLLDEYGQLSNMHFLAVIVSAVGGYMREYAQRENFLMRKLLNWQATRDPLTNLHNRRSFNLHLEMLLRQAIREEVNVALVMIDLDHFKLYNDNYGHQAGDQALKKVGAVFANFARRPLDLAVRLGGEEFAILLHGIDEGNLYEITEQILQEILALHIPHEFSPTAFQLTVSIGAVLAEPEIAPDMLYRKADEILYKVKQSGRNRAAFTIAFSSLPSAQ